MELKQGDKIGIIALAGVCDREKLAYAKKCFKKFGFDASYLHLELFLFFIDWDLLVSVLILGRVNSLSIFLSFNLFFDSFLFFSSIIKALSALSNLIFLSNYQNSILYIVLRNL